jgi:hypothetical protein
VQTRAEDIKAGEIVQIGGLVFTRLRMDMALNKASQRQKARYVEVMRVERVEPEAKEKGGTWIEVMFRGGDCPANERVMFALFRPYELVRVQVEKEG